MTFALILVLTCCLLFLLLFNSHVPACFFTFPGFVACVNQRHLLVNYVHDVKDVLQLRELSSGKLIRDLPLDVGTVVGISCKKKHPDFFYKFTSFTTPGMLIFIALDKKRQQIGNVQTVKVC